MAAAPTLVLSRISVIVVAEGQKAKNWQRAMLLGFRMRRMASLACVLVMMTVVCLPQVVDAKVHGGHNGSSTYPYFRGYVWNTIDGVDPVYGAVVTCEYWSGRYFQSEQTTTGIDGYFYLDPEYPSNSGYYKLFFSYPGFWIEKRYLALPAYSQAVFLEVDQPSYVYYVQTFFTGMNPMTDETRVEYIATCTHVSTVHASAVGWGSSNTFTRVIQSGIFTEQWGYPLQVRQLFMVTGVFEEVFDEEIGWYTRNILAAWSYGGPLSPGEIVDGPDCQADTMTRPNDLYNQLIVPPNTGREVKVGEGGEVTCTVGVKVPLPGGYTSVVLSMGIEITEGEEESVKVTITNRDSSTHMYEWFSDGLGIHVWKVW